VGHNSTICAFGALDQHRRERAWDNVCKCGKPLGPFAKREVMPGNLKASDLENFVRDELTSYAHQTCTAKMGRDSVSVVDGTFKVYGVDNLRVADGSIMPRVTTGNTMAPCMIIGERAGDMLQTEPKLFRVCCGFVFAANNIG
jgi:choline dehydrogenase-like flavoprotein